MSRLSAIYLRFDVHAQMNINYEFLRVEELLGAPEKQCLKCHGEDPKCEWRKELQEAFIIEIGNIMAPYNNRDLLLGELFSILNHIRRHKLKPNTLKQFEKIYAEVLMDPSVVHVSREVILASLLKNWWWYGHFFNLATLPGFIYYYTCKDAV